MVFNWDNYVSVLIKIKIINNQNMQMKPFKHFNINCSHIIFQILTFFIELKNQNLTRQKNSFYFYPVVDTYKPIIFVINSSVT